MLCQFLQTHTHAHTPASAYFVHVAGRHRFEASCQIPVTTFPEASRCSITFNFPPAIGYQRKPTTVTVFFFFFSRCFMEQFPRGWCQLREISSFIYFAPPCTLPSSVSKRIFLGDKAKPNRRLPKTLLESLGSTKWPRDTSRIDPISGHFSRKTSEVTLFARFNFLVHRISIVGPFRSRTYRL